MSAVLRCCTVDNILPRDLQRALMMQTNVNAHVATAAAGCSIVPASQDVFVVVGGGGVYLGHYFVKTNTSVRSPAGRLFHTAHKELSSALVHRRGPPTEPAAQSHNLKLFIATGIFNP